jgi:hypothetical protein
MPLRPVLNACDVEDVMAALGAAVDRVNIAKALHAAAIRGVVAPTRRGQCWVIPREALPDVVAACLQRRACRAAARSHLPLPPFERFQVAAARKMLVFPELARLVPRRLRAAVRKQQEAELARRQAAVERERERLAAIERRRRAELDAMRQRRAAEARWRRDLERRRDEEARNRELADAYRVCRALAMADAAVTTGFRWFERPENQPFVADWPVSRPAWWLPPPGLLAVTRVAEPQRYVPGFQEPAAYRRLVPKYVQGQRWPWRDEAASAEP